MCLSCGCSEPDDDHGNKDHIVTKDVETVGGVEKLSDEQLQKAAAAASITAEDAKKNIEKDYSSKGA